MNIRRHAAGIALTAMVAGGAMTGITATAASAATVTVSASHHHHHHVSELQILTSGYQHIRNLHSLYRYYIRHGAVAFLLSGVTSESPANKAEAVALLHWLTASHVAPADW